MDVTFSTFSGIGGVSIRLMYVGQGRGYYKQLMEFDLPDEKLAEHTNVCLSRCFQQNKVSPQLWDWCKAVVDEPRPEEKKKEDDGS